MEIETRPVDHNSVVGKSNDLVSQMSKFHLNELRLIAYCLAHYDSRHPENHSFYARVSDFTDIFPSMDKKSAYAVIRQVMLTLAAKPLEVDIEAANGKRLRRYRNWFRGFDYAPAAGEFTFYLEADIQPYLLALEGNFTRFRLRDVYQFKAAFSWKLYENLKRWMNIDTWSVDLDQLKSLLGVSGKYPQWSDFRRQITKSLAEINKVSDLKVTYIQKKWGRRVTGLTFKITGKAEDEDTIIDQQTAGAALFDLLIAAGLSTAAARRYAAVAEAVDKVDAVIRKLPKMIIRAKSKNGDYKRYLQGSIMGEIKQQELDFDQPPPPDYQDALDCWQDKRRAGTDWPCHIRRRGVTKRAKCLICFDKITQEMDEIFQED